MSKIIIICGLPRTGTNYWCLNFVLHHNIVCVNHMPYTLIESMESGITAHSLYREWKKSDSFSTHPYRDYENMHLPDIVYSQWDQLSNDKKQMKHVVFKTDYFESHLCRFFSKFKSQIVVLYTVRLTLMDVCEAHKRWIKEGFNLPYFVESFKKSVGSVESLLRAGIQVIPVSISWEHSRIRETVESIMNNHLSLPLNDLQRKFLKVRTPVASGKLRPKQADKLELRNEMLKLYPGIAQWEDRYKNLLKEQLHDNPHEMSERGTKCQTVRN